MAFASQQNGVFPQNNDSSVRKKDKTLNFNQIEAPQSASAATVLITVATHPNLTTVTLSPLSQSRHTRHTRHTRHSPHTSHFHHKTPSPQSVPLRQIQYGTKAPYAKKPLQAAVEIKRMRCDAEPGRFESASSPAFVPLALLGMFALLGFSAQLIGAHSSTASANRLLLPGALAFNSGVGSACAMPPASAGHLSGRGLPAPLRQPHHLIIDHNDRFLLPLGSMFASMTLLPGGMAPPRQVSLVGGLAPCTDTLLLPGVPGADGRIASGSTAFPRPAGNLGGIRSIGKLPVINEHHPVKPS